MSRTSSDRAVRLWILPLLIGALYGTWALVQPGGVAADRVASTDEASDLEQLGADLYAAQCASCHGTDGTGVEDRGPTLVDEGAAAVDYALSTGRMPLSAVNLIPKRGPVRYTDREVDALVAYVTRFGDGPGIPDVDPSRGDVAEGGRIYRLNCAACHVASGAGAAIGSGREAPSLMPVTPTQIGEAILVGPGSMPRFTSLSSDEVDDVAAYIGALQEQDTTGASKFGGAGPVAEGLAAWMLALIPLVALTRWIGTPHIGRDDSAAPTDVAESAEEST